MASALLAGSLQTATAANPTHRFDPSELYPADKRPEQVGGTIVGDFTKAAQRDGNVAVIVKLTADSVASYTGGVNGLAATNPKVRGKKTIDLKGAAFIRRSYLRASRALPRSSRHCVKTEGDGSLRPHPQCRRGDGPRGGRGGRGKAPRRRPGLPGHDPEARDRHQPGLHRGADRVVEPRGSGERR